MCPKIFTSIFIIIFIYIFQLGNMKSNTLPLSYAFIVNLFEKHIQLLEALKISRPLNNEEKTKHHGIDGYDGTC